MSTTQHPTDAAAPPHVCERDTVDYIAHYGAPGIGWHGVCRVCSREWAVVGGTLHDPAAGAHELSPEDVR